MNNYQQQIKELEEQKKNIDDKIKNLKEEERKDSPSIKVYTCSATNFDFKEMYVSFKEYEELKNKNKNYERIFVYGDKNRTYHDSSLTQYLIDISTDKIELLQRHKNTVMGYLQNYKNLVKRLDSKIKTLENEQLQKSI